ncbi:MAG: ShlB/FhaC/HecB family hemolysin secretion/activation protein [Phycisphaerae bacterium]
MMVSIEPQYVAPANTLSTPRQSLHGLIAMAGLVAALGSSMALAAVPTLPPNLNAGAIGNQFQQAQKKKALSPPSTQPALTGQANKPLTGKSGGVKFLLRRVEFSKSAFLTPQYLQSVARSYINKEVTFADLRKLLNTINAEYLKRGILSAQAILPPQKIHDGLVKVQLIEGKLGKVEIRRQNKNAPPITAPGFFTSRLPLEKGQIVDDTSLARAIDYFNRTSNIQLRAALQPGAQFGLTNVLLYAQEPKRVTMDFSVDNYGYPGTGRLEGSESVNLYSPLKLDDQLNVYSVQSQGAIDNSLVYSIPITSFGTQVGISYANSQYTIVNGPYENLDVKGRSNFFGVNLVQPLYVDKHWLFDSGLQYGYDVAHTLLGGVDLGATAVNKWSLGLTIDGSWTRGAFSMVQTVLYANGLAPPNQTSHPFIYQGTFYGYFNIVPQVYASLLGGWQYTPNNTITPDELFQVGGEYSVRGFPTYVAAGNTGLFSQLELHYQPVTFFDAYGFFDQAYLWAPVPEYQRLQSSGIGTKWTFTHILAQLLHKKLSLNDSLSINVWAGFPFNRVSPDQENYELGAGMVYQIGF